MPTVRASMNRFGHVDINTFIQSEVPTRKQHDLREGWGVHFRMDLDTLRAYAGVPS